NRRSRRRRDLDYGQAAILVSFTSPRCIRYHNRKGTGRRSMQSVSPLDVELVDKASLVDHRLKEIVFGELGAEPVERPGGFALHYPKQADVEMGRIWSFENRHGGLERQPGKGVVEHEEGAAGIPAQTLGAHPIAGSAAP